MMDSEKTEAAARFSSLRDQIVAAFEGLEDQAGGACPAGRFEVTPTTRPDGGGGLMSVMRGGRVFEASCALPGRSFFVIKSPCNIPVAD